MPLIERTEELYDLTGNGTDQLQIELMKSPGGWNVLYIQSDVVPHTLVRICRFDKVSIVDTRGVRKSLQDTAIAELDRLDKMSDQEKVHIGADEVLCSLLSTLGYRAVAERFDKIGKWYA